MLRDMRLFWRVLADAIGWMAGGCTLTRLFAAGAGIVLVSCCRSV